MTGLVSYGDVLTGDTGNATEFVGLARGLLSHPPHSVLSPSSFPTPVLERVDAALGHEGLRLSLLICSAPGYSASSTAHGCVDSGKLQGYRRAKQWPSPALFPPLPKMPGIPPPADTPSLILQDIPSLSRTCPAVLLCPNLYP